MKTKNLSPDQITEIIYRICHLGEVPKSVAHDLSVHYDTVCRWVRKYEEREVRRAV